MFEAIHPRCRGRFHELLTLYPGLSEACADAFARAGGANGYRQEVDTRGGWMASCPCHEWRRPFPLQ